MEVPDGLKGKVIPFDMVQKSRFQPELDSVLLKKTRLDKIEGKLDEIRDGLSEDKQNEHLDEVWEFLREKWIEQICDGIKRSRYVSLSQLEKAIARLSKKYENSCPSLTSSLRNLGLNLSPWTARK